MPISFDDAARSGLIDSARGMIRRKYGRGPYPGTGRVFAEFLAEIQSRGGGRDRIDYETARSILRRAITSLQGADRLEKAGDRLRPNQHGLDPSFLQFTSARYVYRTIVRCLDQKTDTEKRIPVDVESETSLTLEQIEEEAVASYSKGMNVISAQSKKYADPGDCIDPIVTVVFAIRTR